MSITPLEKVLIPPKSQEASQIQHARQQKEEHAQEQLGVQYGNTLRQESQQTVKTSKGENNEYMYDEKGRGNGRSSKKKKGKKDKQEKEDKKQIRMSNFDLRI